MVGKRNLVNAFAATLAAIPEVVALLAPTTPIDAYVDSNPSRNSVDKAIYQMQSGQVLIVWRGTRMLTETMSRWTHLVHLCIKPLPGGSYMDLIDAIVDGVPNPGNGQMWRLCPILDGLLPTEISEQTFEPNTEGVDYGLIVTDTPETGDYPNI
jgi:hypothetical protein